MAKTFEILKKRWIEVAVIIALAVIPRFLFGMVLRSMVSKSSGGYGSSLMFVSYSQGALQLIIAAILIVIKAGFFRTAYLHGTQRYRIGALFGQGRRFFWRMAVFGIILRLIYTSVQLFIGFITARCAAQDNYLMFPWWTVTLCSMFVSIVLIKPMLLVPALVVVRDISLIDAVKSMREYKIFRAKELLILFGIGLGLSFGHLFLMSLRNTAFYRPLQFAMSIVGYFLAVAIALSAVRFVAEKSLPIEAAE